MEDLTKLIEENKKILGNPQLIESMAKNPLFWKRFLIKMLPQGHLSSLDADTLDGLHANEILRRISDVARLKASGGGGGGNGGAATFLELTDTPGSYSGQSGKFAKVKATENGLEFGSGAGGVTDHGELTGLEDDDHVQYWDDTRGDTKILAHKNIVNAHHEKTASDEVYGLVRKGLDASKPAAGTAERWYYATDTKILYYDNGAAWVEASRGETAIRLAQLSEKAHSSLTGVTASQHHTKTVAGDLNLADLLEKNHISLTNVLADQHADTKVRTKEVDEGAIAGGKILQYNSTSGKLEYINNPSLGPPVYDSGWRAIAQDSWEWFAHGLPVETLANFNLFIDVQGMNPLQAVHNWFYGGAVGRETQYGYYWSILQAMRHSIGVYRYAQDTQNPEVRVRVWQL